LLDAKLSQPAARLRRWRSLEFHSLPQSGLDKLSVEGWRPEHDDQHRDAEMVRAAMAYSDVAVTAYWGNDVNRTHANGMWPWDGQWWKPSPDPIRNLVKAGALIAAEIDRLMRRELKKRSVGG